MLLTTITGCRHNGDASRRAQASPRPHPGPQQARPGTPLRTHTPHAAQRNTQPKLIYAITNPEKLLYNPDDHSGFTAQLEHADHPQAQEDTRTPACIQLLSSRMTFIITTNFSTIPHLKLSNSKVLKHYKTSSFSRP